MRFRRDPSLPTRWLELLNLSKKFLALCGAAASSEAASEEPVQGSGTPAFDPRPENREVIFKFRRQVQRARLWEVDFPVPSFATDSDHLSEWCQQWAHPGDPSGKIVSVPRARLLAAVSKHMFEAKYELRKRNSARHMSPGSVVA